MLQEPERPTRVPYVGLRPYTADQRSLFFGRDRDALLLRNKIFAAPLTVLYALSGVGKSSLLQALVEPMLREQDAHVLHYERWTEHDPVQALTLELQKSMPADLQGALPNGSLSDVVQAATAMLGRPIVLILDQFEELLLQRGYALEPLGAEIGALVRANANAHVVLSLREEFLAGLDVLRSHILTLASSTFRLRPLDDGGVREAIVEPAERCGGSVEPALVEALLDDLRTSPEQRQHPTAGLLPGHVELPFLQLVCEQLWDAAKAEDHHLTRQQYARFGGVAGIIRNYIQGLTQPLPQTRQAELARLLDLLAPRSGAKMAYAAEDLSHNAHVPPERVTALLDHLASSYVVRIRATATTNWYELYHDAFIRVLRDWVDRQLTLATRRRWRRRAAAVFVTAQFTLLAALFGYRWVSEREHTTKPIRELIRQAEDTQRAQTGMVVDEVAHWLLAGADSGNVGGRMHRLLGLLEEVREPILRFYAREREPEALMGPAPGARLRTGAGDPAAPLASIGRADTINWCAYAWERTRVVACALPTLLLEVRHGARPGFSRQEFEDAWRDAADFLADSLGIPPPLRLVVWQDPQLPPNGMRGHVSGQTFDLSWLTDSTLVSEERMSPAVRAWLLSGADTSWHRLGGRAPKGPWRLVPRWTLPVWRAAGQPDWSKAKLVSLAVLTQLTERPDSLLSRAAVDQLLARARSDSGFPRQLRGALDRARALFIGIAQLGRSIRDMPGLLTALEHDSGAGPPDSVAQRVWRAAVEDGCRLPTPGKIGSSNSKRGRTSRDVGEVLQVLSAEVGRSDARRHQLQLCLLRDLLAEGRYEAVDSVLAALPAPRNASWTPSEQYVLGYWMLHRAAALRHGDPVPDAGTHLAAAFVGWSEREAEAAFPELLSTCEGVWVARQCWAVVDSLVRIRPHSFWLSIYLGDYLARLRSDRADGRRALMLLDSAAVLLKTQPPDDRSRLRAWLALDRARAGHTLAQHAEPVDLQGIAAALWRLLANPKLGAFHWPTPEDVRTELITNRLLVGEVAEAEQVLNASRHGGAVPLGLVTYAFFLHLAADRLDSALALSENALADRPWSSDRLFMAALARLLTSRPNADSVAREFLLTGHEYRDYIRMLQFWSLSERGDTALARALIEARWAQIDTTDWRERMERGDKAVWREMLIGYYAGKRSEGALLAPLETEELFDATPYRFLGDPLPGLRCEAHFYNGLLQSVSGDPRTRRARALAEFEAALSTKFRLYFEYHMARILASRYRNAQGAHRTTEPAPDASATAN